MSSPFVTFEEARRNHLRDGVTWSAERVLDWLESTDEFASWSRGLQFAEGRPIIDAYGRKFHSEEEYLGIPEWARSNTAKEDTSG